ncbi:unnamed protein product [Rotaria magnacalcarata]|uniref:Uncharacterized protein n=1 Tax=Rotaria magnacalcarata TaxID=392030 RepID=A0A816RXW8_9BILA|nr:unnamed protein product [Rotaria magnacalcarata]
MFDIFRRVLYPFHMYFLLYLCVNQDINFALPNVQSKDINEIIFSSLPNRDQLQVKINRGKDQLNAYHSTNTRANVIKTVFIIVGGILMLAIVGGIISIIVYYVKQE